MRLREELLKDRHYSIEPGLTLCWFNFGQTDLYPEVPILTMEFRIWRR